MVNLTRQRDVLCMWFAGQAVPTAGVDDPSRHDDYYPRTEDVMNRIIYCNGKDQFKVCSTTSVLPSFIPACPHTGPYQRPGEDKTAFAGTPYPDGD